MLAHLLVISSIISSALTTRYHRSLLERGIYTGECNWYPKCLSTGSTAGQIYPSQQLETTILDKTVEKIVYLGKIFLNIEAVSVRPSPPSTESNVVVYSKESLIPERL